VAANNTGITVLSVAVAISAYLVSDIWARELQKQVDDLDRVMTSWRATTRYVKLADTLLGDKVPPDLTDATQWVQKKVDIVSEETATIGASLDTIPLDSGVRDAWSKFDSEANDLAKQTIDSSDKAALLGKKVTHLIALEEAIGFSQSTDAWTVIRTKTKKELRIRYGGYALSILAIIVAGIAQIVGKA
jgi:hypothetical protein